MPLLIVPLVILVLLVLWLLLLPLSLWQRYRLGKARRRAWPWMVNLNSWLLLLSAGVFLASMALTDLWWPGALGYASAGLGIGLVTGVLGLWLSRFESTAQGLFYTPNPWLALGLTLLVAARIAMGFVEMWRYWQGREALSIIPVLDHASLFAVAGLLIGHYLGYTWGLRRRLRRTAV
ncbi:DUF1453 domain-containing protein [Pseudoxanthomonas yeongjuensis]|uniref:DUF1453 domain-containing protein n=1 Tax=Pseudoxanthomonas yeongjuensis TaxID=377616 RepID=UPI001390FCEB|nr:DUF1453 domain-containing protein [Pseudoxanthomonas yeongjuensis]KAF1716947.1 DUF1453 domain-containing protein [Pseudoxanthomonas yeongjuensis]